MNTQTATVNKITIDELQERLRETKPLHFWNVLTDDYFTGELIPGSVRRPLDTVGRDARAAGVPLDAEIVVYCSGVTCPQSVMAAEKLTAIGYRNVRAFEGGLGEWKEQGLPLAAAQPAM